MSGGFELPHFGLARAPGAWEALAGSGVFVDLAQCPDYARDPEDAKRVARLIVGEQKAAIAETLTDADRAAFKTFVAGLKAAFAMASVPPERVVAGAGDDGRDGHTWVSLCDAKKRELEPHTPSWSDSKDVSLKYSQ